MTKQEKKVINQEQPIIKRIKDKSKKSKVIIALVGLAIIVSVFLVIKYTSKPKLKPAKEELASINQQIKELDKQRSKMTESQKMSTDFKKIELFEKQLKKYKEANRTSDALDLLIQFMAYLINNNAAEYGIPHLENFKAKELSINQKISFYSISSQVYYASNQPKKAKQADKKVEQLTEELTQKLNQN